MTSHIRIPDVSPVAQALADGARSVFPFSFPIFQAGDIEVRANSILVAAGYTVVGEGSSTGGAVIFADAPASGVRITLRRRQTYARTDDFLDERTPTPHQLNDAVDRNVAALQELDEQVSRSVRRSLSADLSQPLDLTLPAPEAGKAIGWNGSADALVNLAQADVSDFLRKSQNLADLPDTAVARGSLGLGSAALRAEGDFATAAQGARADGALQSSDIGNSVQAHDAALDWLAGNLGDAGKALLDDADPAAQRATLGLGSAATKDVGTGANQVVALDAAGHLPAVNGSAVTSLDAGNLNSGSVAAARLGSGTADGSTFLRGDGTWATLAGIGGLAFGNVQTFTSSGTFTVPAGVTTVLVMAVGGGGGGGNNSSVGGTGGQSSFGTQVIAPGGGGGGASWYAWPEGGSNPGPGTRPGYVAGINVVGLGTNANVAGSYGLGGSGGGGSGGVSGSPGDNGAVAVAFCPVSPGQSVSIVVGTAGTTYGGAAQPGAVIIRY